MPTTKSPRYGSMQFWPRVRAKSESAKIRKWAKLKDPKLLGFAGYKVGMTHIMFTDNNPHSMTKNKEIFCPVTIVECPPLKTLSMRFYKKTKNGLRLVSEILSNVEKDLLKLLPEQKKKQKKEAPKEYDEIRLVAYTQPRLTTIGKKIPRIFEISLGGAKEQQLEYANKKLGKEIHVDEIFKEGQHIDIHAVTKGKGFQGPVRRFGIGLRSHKSEKSRRNPGSLGSWKAQGHIMYRVAHAGKMGYHTRTEYNKQLMKIGKKPEEINTKGGFLRYGAVRNPYLLIKGSISGTPKRLIKMTYAIMPKKYIQEAPQLKYISLSAQQGN